MIELKAGKFKPEHDNPTVGLLLCKSQNQVVAEYALGDQTQPLGMAEFELLASLPAAKQLTQHRTDRARNGVRARQNLGRDPVAVEGWITG